MLARNELEMLDNIAVTFRTLEKFLIVVCRQALVLELLGLLGEAPSNDFVHDVLLALVR